MNKIPTVRVLLAFEVPPQSRSNNTFSILDKSNNITLPSSALND